jgi:hypothetical protein
MAIGKIALETEERGNADGAVELVRTGVMVHLPHGPLLIIAISHSAAEHLAGRLNPCLIEMFRIGAAQLNEIEPVIHLFHGMRRATMPPRWG